MIGAAKQEWCRDKLSSSAWRTRPNCCGQTRPAPSTLLAFTRRRQRLRRRETRPVGLSSSPRLRIGSSSCRTFALTTTRATETIRLGGSHRLSLSPGPTRSSRATYGTGFKAPTLTELYVNNPSFMVVGNPNLLPETSKGYDFGFEQPLLHDRLRFGATYFHNDITNLIEGTTNPTTFVSTYVNVGQATTQGVETFAAFSLNSRLNLARRLHLYRGKGRLDGNGTTPPAYEQGKPHGILERDRSPRRHRAGRSMSGLGWINRPGTAELTAPGYTLVNLSANYAVTDRISVFGRINNLLNEQYEDPLGFLRPGFGVYGGFRVQVGGAPSSLASSDAAATTAAPSSAPSIKGGGAR